MRCEDIGVNVSKAKFAEFLDSVQPGQFFSVKGYENANEEVADHILRFGIKYGNLKARDIRVLNEVLAGARQTFTVVHGVWVPDEFLQGAAPSILLDADRVRDMGEEANDIVTATIRYEVKVGEATLRVAKTGPVNIMDVTRFTNRKAAGRTQCTISYRLDSTHPLAIAAIGGADLQGTLLQSLIAPVQKGADYDKEAQSAYSLNKEGRTVWYIRDVLRVHKNVRKPGEYPFKASMPINAIKEAISNALLLTAKYRQFILTAGQFESITIEGQAVLCDGVEEEFYFALPQHVAEAVRAEAAIS